MAIIITRMPSTGSVTNVAYTAVSKQEAQEIWSQSEHDRNCVTVLSDEEFDALPRCNCCGNWVEEQMCAECR